MNPRRRLGFALLAALPTVAVLGAARPANGPAEVRDLVAALLGPTPMTEDLRRLTDEIGGRPTGSAANRAAVEWALRTLEAAGVPARRESFTMPAGWLERRAVATIRFDDVPLAGDTDGGGGEFPARIAAMPFSAPTPTDGFDAPLLDAGRGEDTAIAGLGQAARGALLLVGTDELLDVDGLFREYREATRIEARAVAAGAAGVVYVGSRPDNLLHRHVASRGSDNESLLMVIERSRGLRALRLLRAGHRLRMHVVLDIATSGPYRSDNVIGEIRGATDPDEYVVIGAHLDSWGLGTGALDDGCNVAMIIDIARQIRRLDLHPRRTIRFCLFNGEEQGMFGSWAYVRQHADELDRHVMASAYDIGSGRITGMYTNGRPELIPVVDRLLAPVSGLGPFIHVDEPIVGTDNFDFMLEGVANLVASQESANYGPNYHAGSDTFDKVDLGQLRLNGAIAAAMTWGFASTDVTWNRQDRAAVETLVRETSLAEQMKMFPPVWEAWARGARGRRP
ncbi:MAG: M28 family metallopeptidase [Acidobacteriota bacterium]